LQGISQPEQQDVIEPDKGGVQEAELDKFSVERDIGRKGEVEDRYEFLQLCVDVTKKHAPAIIQTTTVQKIKRFVIKV
jgi:hypothetical protein